jgi:hypothetical protein
VNVLGYVKHEGVEYRVGALASSYVVESFDGCVWKEVDVDELDLELFEQLNRIAGEDVREVRTL